MHSEFSTLAASSYPSKLTPNTVKSLEVLLKLESLSLDISYKNTSAGSQLRVHTQLGLRLWPELTTCQLLLYCADVQPHGVFCNPYLQSSTEDDQTTTIILGFQVSKSGHQLHWRGCWPDQKGTLGHITKHGHGRGVATVEASLTSRTPGVALASIGVNLADPVA